MVLLKVLSGIALILAFDAILRTESFPNFVTGGLTPRGNETFGNCSVTPPSPFPWISITWHGVCVTKANNSCSGSQGTDIGNQNNICPNGTTCCMGFTPTYTPPNGTFPLPPGLGNLTTTTTSTTTTTTTTTPAPETTTTTAPETTTAAPPRARKPRFAEAFEFLFPSNEDAPPSPEDGKEPNVMNDEWHICNTLTKDAESYFRNPSYPRVDSRPNVCQHIVLPRNDTCAVRYEILEGYLEDRLGDACSIDSMQILNSGNAPTAPQCGKLDGYQFTVKVNKAGSYVRNIITTQSDVHLWNIRVTQIPCSKVMSLADEQNGQVCGRKGPGRLINATLPEEQPQSVEPAELLRSTKSKSGTVPKFVVRSTKAEKLLIKNVVQQTKGIKIFKGNETGVNEYPWQALILVAGRPLCGGTLISDQWILTAGHCTGLSLRLPLSILLMIDLGDHDLQSLDDSPNRVYKVSRVVPHVQHQVILHDIALLKLSRKVDFSKAISPVCLPNDKELTYAGETAISTGWGKTEKEIISPVLRQAELNVISNEACSAAWDKLGEGGGEMIQKEMLCAGGGEAGPCNGDSGGPLVIEDKKEKGKWRLIGLTSFGALKGCALPGIPAVYTRVSSYLEWMAMNMAEV